MKKHIRGSKSGSSGIGTTRPREARDSKLVYLPSRIGVRPAGDVAAEYFVRARTIDTPSVSESLEGTAGALDRICSVPIDAVIARPKTQLGTSVRTGGGLIGYRDIRIGTVTDVDGLIDCQLVL